MNKKKIVNIVGGILCLVAVFFLAYRLYNLRTQMQSVITPTNCMIIGVVSVIYCGALFLCAYAWIKAEELVLGRKVPIRSGYHIWNNSNMMKYLPGNVFQYLGKNQLAVDLGENHMSVALGTVIDVIFNLLGVLLVALFTGHNLIGQFWSQMISYMNRWIVVLIFGALVALAIILILVIKNRLAQLKARAKDIFAPAGLAKLATILVMYLAFAVISGALFIALLNTVFGVPLTKMDEMKTIGAFLFSWIGGFITPGAPGGLGVREALLTMMMADSGILDEILIAIVVFRVVNIVGDCVCFGLGYVFRPRRSD